MWYSEKVKERLDAARNHVSRFKTTKKDTERTEAAVLVPIVLRDGVPFVLLTVRSQNLDNFPGQVCLPGGKRDPHDTSLVATALRETREEIGLPEHNITVLGSLPPYSTREIFIVTPIVALVSRFEDFHPVLNPLEVCETFIVPLENFIKKECHNVKDFIDHQRGETWTMDYFEFSQESSYHIIWGLTAVVLTAAASVVCDYQPEFTYQDCLLSNNNNFIYKHYLSRKSKL